MVPLEPYIAVVEASLRILMFLISEGFNALYASAVDGIPSITINGAFPLAREPVPRTRINALEPGAPF
ncbi:hypothetical protein D3C72_2092210 [compost metagenome]